MDSITKTMSKWLRNTEAYVASGGSEFSNRVRKATYAGDDDEAKRKHVDYIIECFEGMKMPEVPQERAFELFAEIHYKEGRRDFIANVKSFCIVETALKRPKCGRATAKWVVNQTSMMPPSKSMMNKRGSHKN